ncbi:hypothetical protein ACTMU2_13180 [Cupriavidus basilensis]
MTQLNSVLLLNIEALLFPSESQVTRVINERFVERQGMLEITSDSLYEDDPHAILETFLLYERTPEHQGPVAAHAAGPLQRAYRDGCTLAPRPGKPPAVPGHPAGNRRASPTRCA